MASRNETGFFKRWIFTTVGVLAAAQVVPGITANGWPAVLITALVLGVFNAILKPILFILTLPIQILTLGLFTLVINAILLSLASVLVGPFNVDGFWPAFFGGLVISFVSGFLNVMFGGSSQAARAHVNINADPPSAPSEPRDNPPPGKGPIIDV